MKLFREYRFTIIGIVVAIAVYLFQLITDLDLFELIFETLEEFEEYEIDELAFIGLILVYFTFIDLILFRNRKENKLKLEQQKLNVLRSTTRSLQDLINNIVVALQFVRSNNEETNALDEESIEMINELIKGVTEKMNALGSLEHINEKEIYDGISVIDYDVEKTTSEPKK